MQEEIMFNTGRKAYTVTPFLECAGQGGDNCFLYTNGARESYNTSTHLLDCFSTYIYQFAKYCKKYNVHS